MKHDLVKDYTGIWLDSLRNGETELNNTNKLVNTYNGITGLKTGTTSNAGFCVSATAERDGMNLVAVVLGSDTSEDRFNTAAYLLDWGFANYSVIEPEIDESKINSVKINLGDKKEINPICGNTSKIVIKKGSEDIEYKYSVEKEISAPVKKGDKLGEITLEGESGVIGKIDLVSPEDIVKVNLEYIFNIMIANI